MQRFRPDQVSVALDNGMRAPQFQSFLRIQGRVDSAKNNEGASFARDPADRVAAQRVSSMNSYSYCVSWLDPSRIQALQSLIADLWIAVRRAGVACASTYSQRGVITAVPNDVSLGLTKCTFKPLLWTFARG